MSQKNVEIVRSSYHAWFRSDLDRAFQAFDPEIEWCLPEGGINTGTYRGRAAVEGLMKGYLEAFEYFRMEPERFFDAGDRVVVFIRSFGKGKGSGAEVQINPAHLWTMRDGKAIRVEVFPNRERQKALEAAGLSEQDAHADS